MSKSMAAISTDHASIEILAGNEDLLAEILSRLPAKSLLRFKSVSRQWLNLIFDPRFCLLHSRRHPNPPCYALFFNHSLSTSTSSLSSTFDFIPLHNNPSTNSPPFLSRFSSSSIAILQSSNGLLLCKSVSQSDSTYYVCNPTINQISQLPSPVASSRSGVRSISIVGLNLAFDPSRSDGYKVICVWKDNSCSYIHEISHGIDVYSPLVGVWRRSVEFFAPIFDMEFDRGVYWNGNIHWLSHTEKTMFFDVENECLKDLTLPPAVLGAYIGRFRYFGESHGHLHLAEIRTNCVSEFDVLELDGDHMCWIVKYRVNLDVLGSDFCEMFQDCRDRFGRRFRFYAFSILAIVCGEEEEDSALIVSIPGSAKHNLLIILVAPYPAVKESFNIYYDITDILSILIDKFMELEVPEGIKVHEVFSRISKQFDELDSYCHWCKDEGISRRTSGYPEVERITPKKLDLMDEFIRGKAASAQNKGLVAASDEEDNIENEEKESEAVEEDLNAMKALPPPECFSDGTMQGKKQEERKEDGKVQRKEANLINLGEDAVTSEEHGNKLALALFDGSAAAETSPPPAAVWGALKNSSDWETALLQSASCLSNQKSSLGGGFDTMLLDGLYQQGAAAMVMSAYAGGTGSASSVALGSAGNPPLLALPAPMSSGGTMMTVNPDPFAASVGVPAPPFVQMSDMEKKQKLLLEEQLMWQQYARDGMQGQIGFTRYETRQQDMRGYGYGYGYGY